MARRRFSSLATVALLACLALPASAAANEIETIQTPSRFVDPGTAVFGDVDPRPDRLRANVLLPDGYDRSRRYPILYLLHGAGENYASWNDPAKGDVRRTLAGLDAIVVMPDGGLGFYTNWWNRGRRGDPAWERHHLEHLIPLVERRYRIREGRRWHAIAGFSMGGYGTSHYAARRPDYFGTAVPMSGFVSIQRPQAEVGLSIVSGVDFGAIFGPSRAFYAEGHNPLELSSNYEHSRVMLYTGNGIPRPGVPTGGPAAVSGVLEAELLLQNQEFAESLKRAGADSSLRTHLGVHDWPYWREDIRDAVARGLFRPVPANPHRWTYRTVARNGQAWDLRYRFAQEPTGVARLERDGASFTVTGEGLSPLRLRTREGCEIEVSPGRRVELPRRGC